VYDYKHKALADIEAWFNDKMVNNWPVIVAFENGIVLGYGTYGTFRFKEGYKYTVEHSVYVSREHTGKGVGKHLLAELIRLAKEQGYHTMIGGIDADNKGSIAFHAKFGFTEAGLLKEVGYKFDKWLDVQFMQLLLD
jgi:L-amino acid N-acyltransferase